MSWIKLDDAILDNLKVCEVGPLGFAVHVAGIIFCARNLTDGKIPITRVGSLLDFSGVHIDTANPIGLPAHGQPRSMGGNVVDIDDIVAAIVAAGLWHPIPGGYEINDYLEYNPSKAEVMAERDRIRQIRSEAGKAGAASKLSKRQANQSANGQQTDQQTGSPVPVPVPVTTKTVKTREDLSGYVGHADRLAGPGVLGSDGGGS